MHDCIECNLVYICNVVVAPCAYHVSEQTIIGFGARNYITEFFHFIVWGAGALCGLRVDI